ncbi:MAG: DUF4271 domain-containing protein [Bacteroidota bacterium]
MTRIFYSLLIIMLSFSCALAQGNEKPIDNWFTIKDNRIKPVTSLSDHSLVYLNLEPYTKEDTIKICHSSPIDLWINNQLFFRELPGGCDKFRLNDLIQKANQDSIILSISYDRYTSLKASVIIDNNRLDVKDFSSHRGPNKVSDFYLQALLIIIITLSILKFFFPNKFERLLSNPLASRTASDLDEFYTGFWHIENLITTILFSMIAAVQILYIQQELVIWPYLNTWGDSFFQQWLFVTGLVFLLLLSKYIFSRLMSMLLQTRVLPNIQFQDFVQIFIWLSATCLILFFVDLYLIGDTTFRLVNLAYLFSIIVLIAFQLWLYFKFVKFYSHKKLLIISYLCTTEILPVFLIIFWLVK